MKKISWIIIATAYLVLLLGYIQMQRVVADQVAEHGWACGLPSLGIMSLTLVLSGALSLFASVWRGFTVGWWKTTPWLRIAGELPVFTLPFLACLFCLVPFIWL
jgi:tetrahydromethanopterin S-methyltransferase subunit C